MERYKTWGTDDCALGARGGSKVRIGIIGPSENEIMPFITKMEDKQTSRHAMIDFHVGRFENIDVVAAFSGVCKVNAAIATQIMIDRFGISKVILTGVAGALSDNLAVGDIVIGNEIAYHDVAREILTEYHPWMPDIYFRSDESLIEHIIEISKSNVIKNKFHVGRIITGEKFITENERNNLIEDFEPLCVDMESASVAHVCYANNIPFIVIRSMSDFANEDGSDSFEDNVEAASLISLSIAEELLKRIGL